jgi:hypothetical protein
VWFLSIERRYQSRIYPNVTVLGVNVGGLSLPEAKQALEDHVRPFNETPIVLTFEDRTWGVTGEELGLTDDEIAFYDALATNESALTAIGDDKLKVIATELIKMVRRSVTIDWTLRETARAKIRVIVKRILSKWGYPPDLQEEAVRTVLQQAELLCADWSDGLV